MVVGVPKMHMTKSPVKRYNGETLFSCKISIIIIRHILNIIFKYNGRIRAILAEK